VLVSGVNLFTSHYISMNAFEPLLWMGCALIVIRIIKTGNQRLWLWVGVLAGLGLNNKYSMGFFGTGIVIGLLLTSQRRVFLKPWIWLGGAIAVAMILPNLIWNIQHHFPFFELMANIRRGGRNIALTPLQFLGQQVLNELPANLPIWLAGLWYFFFMRDGTPYRMLGGRF
jgi:4-amino-4-deoxy-L-arabinose transferase-like glycosyltransferase